MKEPMSLYQIFVNTPTKVLCLRDVHPDLSIIKLKSKVEIKTGIPVEQQELLLGGSILLDDSRIVETQLKDKNVIRMVPKLKETKDLIEMVLRDDLAGILNIGVQLIVLSEANNESERQRLLKWNKRATQRAFIAVCVACANGMLDLVVNLLKLSAFFVNQVTLYGRSALHFAAARGSIGCICVLLDNYIDPSIEDSDGKTAQDIASEHGHLHCKRRIWLYRWSVTPKVRRNNNHEDDNNKKESKNDTRHSGEYGGKLIRLPILENNNSYSKENGSFEPHSEDPSSELPNLGQRSPRVGPTQSSNNRSDWKLESFPAEHSTNYSRPLSNQISVSAEETTGKFMLGDSNMEPKEKTEQGTQTMERETEGDDFATMLYLADKYGYVISENTLLHKQDPEVCKNSFSKKDVRSQKSKRIMQVSMANYVDLQEISNGEEKDRLRGRTPNSRAKLPGRQEKENLREPKGAIRIAKEKHNQTEYDEDLSIQEAGEIEHARERASKWTESYENEMTQPRKNNEIVDRNRQASLDDSGSANTREHDTWRNSRSSIKTMSGKIGIEFVGRQNNDKARASFEQWLERKAQEKKTTESEEASRTVNQNEKRKEINEQAFRKWLQLKKARYRTRSASVVRPISTDGNNDKGSNNGISYESWMTKKSKDKPRSLSLPVASTHTVVARAYSSGITHDEWLKSKKDCVAESLQNKPNDASKFKNNKRLNGITFEDWMSTKHQLGQIEKIQQATAFMQQQYQKDMANERKLKNPKIKTFEEWQISKKYEERLQRSKEKKDKLNNHRKVKFEDDSNLVYNMWLLNKHMYEMQVEEDQMNEAREVWEKKKKALVRVNTR